MPAYTAPYTSRNGSCGEPRPERTTSITVVAGGCGAVGQMLRRELGHELGEVVDIDPRGSLAAGDILAPGTVERDLLRRADVVVLAVPESIALAALPVLAPLLGADTLLVETLSVKTRFAQAIACRLQSFEAIGINPMFGPLLGMEDRAVAVVPLLAGARAAWFVSLLAERGARITELSVEDHDRATAALQVMPHVFILAFARAFASRQLDPDSILGMAPPPARAILSLAARMAGGNPAIYSEIQDGNPFARSARESLRQALAEVIDASIDPDAFGDLLGEVASELGGSYGGLLQSAEQLVRELRPSTDALDPVLLKRL